jgi:HD superfamily phosphohydrolase
MAEEYRHKIIIDPVHGDIGLSEIETHLIDSATFQRLRRLKQLGFASMVYPNATYSRFAHSLGVLHVTSRVTEVFRRSGQLQGDDDIKKLRIAALLHDIGHYPYSHLMELIDWDSYVSGYLEKKRSQNGKNVAKVDRYPKHDKVAGIIITKRQDIKENLEENDIEPAEIAALIEGKHPNIPNLLHQSLDVDRMDYLTRDSLNTGVPYGKVDLNYILNNLEVTSERNTVLNAKARFAAEHLLLARYFMFNTVYLHKTVFGFEEVVRRIILLLLQGKDTIYRSGSEIEKMAVTDDFLDFHDGYIDKFIDRYAGQNNDEPLTILSKAVKLRRPPKLIHEVFELYDSQRSHPSPKYELFRRCMERDLEQIADNCEIRKECLIWRETKDVEFEALNPFTSISRAPDMKDEEMRELVRIKESSGGITNLIEDEKSIIHYLSQLTLKVIRLYAVEGNASKLEKLKAEVKKRL